MLTRTGVLLLGRAQIEWWKAAHVGDYVAGAPHRPVSDGSPLRVKENSFGVGERRVKGKRRGWMDYKKNRTSAFMLALVEVVVRLVAVWIPNYVGGFKRRRRGMQHQKKSEVQIGKESRGVSSDYRRPPPLLTLPNNNENFGIVGWQDEVLSTPHKRVGQVMQSGKAMAKPKLSRNPSSLSRSSTIKDRIDTFPCLHEASTHKPNRWIWQEITARRRSDRDEMMAGRRFKFQVLLPPFVIVSIPCFWWYLKVVQNNQGLVDLTSDAIDLPSDTTVLGLWFDFFAVLVFVTAVVISIKIAFPQLSVGYILPSMRLVRGKLGQSWSCMAVAWMKPIAALLADDKERRRIPGSPSVTWTIGSKPKLERSKIVREGVQVYTNGDVYEGEFHQGKSSGSGVYYYYMSGRYEGDWVDGKYDGYGVETWARGSRYRGQYRQGLRHGYGVYRFYTGDVYAGEWCNGQSHGYGAHTCEDGSRYVGEFKWGVKHGLGYYHFRYGFYCNLGSR